MPSKDLFFSSIWTPSTLDLIYAGVDAYCILPLSISLTNLYSNQLRSLCPLHMNNPSFSAYLNANVPQRECALSSALSPTTSSEYADVPKTSQLLLLKSPQVWLPFPPSGDNRGGRFADYRWCRPPLSLFFVSWHPSTTAPTMVSNPGSARAAPGFLLTPTPSAATPSPRSGLETTGCTPTTSSRRCLFCPFSLLGMGVKFVLQLFS